MPDEPLLEVRRLTVSFGAEPVVKGISFELPKNCWACLVGESGSGKTLTGLSLTRLVRNAEVSGVINWHGDASVRNLLTLNSNELFAIRGRHIAYIFQDPHSSLNPVLTIGEQMMETYSAHFRSRKEEAEKAALISLSEVRLEARRVFASYPHELSGGMKQRVMIAMALLNGPKLLVADEPTTSLDVTVESEIIQLLQHLRTEWPMSFLFITHNIVLASRTADVIFVMQAGQIVETMRRGPSTGSGQGPEGFTPTHPYSKMLFAAGLENVTPKTVIPV